MCTAQAALGVAQTTANYFIEDKASRDAIKFSEARSEEIGKATVEDAVRKFSQLNRRSNQESEAASRQIQSISRQARAAGGQVRAGAGASGVEGNAVDALVRDFEAQELTRIEVTRENLDNTRDRIDDQFQGVSAEAQNRIFNAQGPAVQRPSIFNALFSIGSSVAAGYADRPGGGIDPESGDLQ